MSDLLHNYVQTSSEGSNILPNLPFLKLISSDFEKAGINFKITVFLSDSENFWVGLFVAQIFLN